jgi:hypothetical protein
MLESAPRALKSAPPRVAQADGVAGTGIGSNSARVGRVGNGRVGKPMRPDVGRVFDRLEAAARMDGLRLIITSGYGQTPSRRASTSDTPIRGGCPAP